MNPSKPLAERMRPKNLSAYVGQKKIVGENGVLRKAIENNNIPSIILWGPPGVGKTTLAQVIGSELKRPMYSLSAVHSGVKDVRETISKAQKNSFFNASKPILFIDEIHRFSKSQQDSLLGAVEKGIVVLIGATTENPSFEVIPSLLSRCQVYILKPLAYNDLKSMVDSAFQNDEFYKKLSVEINEYDSLIKYSSGDGRRLYNLLELLISQQNSANTIVIDNQFVESSIQENLIRYDKTGEQHYDIISAFIKSIRGSDPNAAVYYLARMIEGGEDPKFIARRLLILASEDIGLANPNALLLATSTFQAVQVIGMPESRIILSQTAIYLASSEKSNSAYAAINTAQKLVRDTGNLSVPLHIRNAPTQLMKALNYAKEYKYAHDFEGNFVNIDFLPSEIKGIQLYKPSTNPAENKLANHLKNLWKEKYNF